MQLRGPALNGMKAQGCASATPSGLNLSGLNLSGSGKYSGRRCVAYGEITTSAPAGRMYPSENNENTKRYLHQVTLTVRKKYTMEVPMKFR